MEDIIKDAFPLAIPLIMYALNYFQDKVLPDLKMPRIAKWAISTVVGYILGWLAGNPQLGAFTGAAASAAYTEGSMRAEKRLDK